MKKVVIVDSNLGNLFSVKHICDFYSINAFISSDKKDILDADALIMPGVGAFREAMNNLDKLDLILPIKDMILSGKPIFGVCLGMQLLFTESEEYGLSKGLNLIEGSIKKFPKEVNGVKLKTPNVGWNQIYNLKFLPSLGFLPV